MRRFPGDYHLRAINDMAIHVVEIKGDWEQSHFFD